ncbi:MAG: response regulator [Gammaproteobacteria bacterium]|nr:response regulator [Gammaproteobacteria bacterium]MDH3412288.1 response regulator [Gammaproteobacteria bacterium]
MSAPAVILMVDDDERLRRTVCNYLRTEGFQVNESGTGEQMRTSLASEPVDLVILDLMLPDESGLNLARELRARSDVAIIMLTGKVETVDKIVGLEIGADDYVTKPFDHRELLARVRTVLRRAPKARRQTNTVPVSRVRFEGWVLDLVTQELVSAKGRVVHLTSHQYQLLASLVTHADRPLSRSEISNLLAGRDWSPLNRSVDVLVAKLRKKIETDPKAPKLIKTVRGVGYKFAARVEFTG